MYAVSAYTVYYRGSVYAWNDCATNNLLTVLYVQLITITPTVQC